MTARPTRAAARRTLYLRRRPLAALCAFVAVLATLLVLAPTPAPTVGVLAARTALPAGTILGPEHVTRLDVAQSALPEGAAPADADLAGRALAGPVAANSILTDASVSGGERLARPGHVVAALPLPTDGIAALVRPGVHLDVFDAGGALVADEVRVVAPPDTPGGNPVDITAGGRTALVEVPVDVAAKIASLGGTSLTVVVR